MISIKPSIILIEGLLSFSGFGGNVLKGNGKNRILLRNIFDIKMKGLFVS